jgi:hypothetical protein
MTSPNPSSLTAGPSAAPSPPVALQPAPHALQPPVAAAAAKGALPTFLIIGAPKTGTTSLHNYLAQHPEIQMSSVKEPNFFAPHRSAANERRRIGDLDTYRSLFDPKVAVRGEASTPYTEYPLRQGVPERIKGLIPDVKLIYVVRDPVERTVSHYNHFAANMGIRATLAEVLSDLSDPRSPFICASLYGLQLELYLRLFAQDRILVLDQADLLADRRATLRKVFAFLSVDQDFDSPAFADEYLKATDRHVYPAAFARFVELQVTPRLRWLPPRTRHLLRRSVERSVLPSLKPSQLDDRLRGRLEEYYAGEVDRLRQLTGMSFPTWTI